MKKMIRFFVVLATVALFASCSIEEKDGTFSYHCVSYGNVASQERAQQLGEFFDTVCDGYFKESHSYSGKESETMKAACTDFALNCNIINEDTVLSYLEPGEYVVMYLVSSGNGAQLMYAVWTKPGEESGAE